MEIDLKGLVRTVPDYPKKGIMFRDITTLLLNSKGLVKVIDMLKERYMSYQFDKVVGIESRGFIVGAALAYALEKGFVPIRKKGKLPGDIIGQNYNLEYGTDTIEIHSDALAPGEKVILVDDLLATGGTAIAGKSLLDKLNAEIVEACFIIDLPDLKGGKRLKEAGVPFYTLMDFDGD